MEFLERTGAWLADFLSQSCIPSIRTDRLVGITQVSVPIPAGKEKTIHKNFVDGQKGSRKQTAFTDPG
jgi:hypothetical protein